MPFDWTSQKRKIASPLLNGECGGSYDEAALILCYVLTAPAAQVWLGDRIDQPGHFQLFCDISFFDSMQSVNRINVIISTLAKRVLVTLEVETD